MANRNASFGEIEDRLHECEGKLEGARKAAAIRQNLLDEIVEELRNPKGKMWELVQRYENLKKGG